MSKHKTQNRKSGFTLLEILLVVGIISILAGIVILAINPTKQLGDTRNAQRRSDVLTILNAVYQYSIDHNGSLPSGIASYSKSTACDTGPDEADSHTASEIQRTETDGTLISNTADVDLYTDLVGSEASTTYLVNIPGDPSLDATKDETGYHIFKTASNRVTVCAPLAENSADIYVTR